MRHSSRTFLTTCLLAASVASTATGQTAPTEPAPAPAAPAAPAHIAPPPIAADFDWVELTLVTDDKRAAVYAKEAHKVAVGDDVVDGWTFVCLAPCDQRVDPRRAYRVMGEGLVPSIEFNLAPGAGRVAIQVRAEHPASSAATTTLLAIGGVTALLGVLFLLADVEEQAAASSLESSGGVAHPLRDQASAFGLAGGATVGIGVGFGAIALIYNLVAGGKTQLAPARAPAIGDAPARSEGVHAIPFGFAF